MAQHFEKFLSKLLDDGTTRPLTEYSITASDAPTESERKAYDFIRSYAQENGGKAPSIRALIEEVPAFTYREGVTDSFAWVAEKVKNETAIREVMRAVADPKTEEILNSRRGNELIEHLQAELESIKMGTSVRDKVGTDLKRDHAKFLDEYKARKAGESFKTWASKFPTINAEIGGYYSGNIYAWIGRSGRGKSVFVMEEAIEAAMQGANVLVWAMEMAWFEWMARAYASISARRGYVSATIDGVDYEVGFENRALLSGKLTEEFESGFEIFLASLNDIMPGNITVRAVDDEDFNRRDVRQLETDIMQTEADVVVVDPIYYMTFEKNTSKTAGGDVAETSKKLRALAGRSKAVIHVITQAEEIRDDTDEDGQRELKAAKRAEVKKSKAILEDSSNLFGIDSVDGRGIIELGKGRQGGEGVSVEVTYLPNYGVVKEIEIGELAAEQFTKQF